MAPTSSNSLLARDRCDQVDYYGNCYYSTWNDWGRWVALVLIVLSFLLLGLAFSCFSQRRRRRRGLAPMYGTGWMGGKANGQQQHNQYGAGGNWAHQQQGGYQPPPPPYMGNQGTGTTFQSHDGYYGHGQNQGYGQQSGGIELQQPGASYQPQRGGENVYEAPLGAPPGKGDGIIR